jgi:Flp pilus assembly protein TadB
MSEQAKVAALQEKIRKERNRARGLRIFSVVGFILFVAFLVMYFVLNQGIVTLAVAIVGVLGGCSGIYGSAAANRRKNELIAELDKVGSGIST